MGEIGAFSHGIFHHCLGTLDDHVVVTEHPGIALEVQPQSPLSAPVHNIQGLLCRKALVHDDLSVILHIGIVAANHAVQCRKIPLQDFRLGAPCADIYFVSCFPGFPDCFLCAVRTLCLVVDQGAVHIQKHNFPFHDLSSLSSAFLPDPAREAILSYPCSIWRITLPCSFLSGSIPPAEGTPCPVTSVCRMQNRAAVR